MSASKNHLIAISIAAAISFGAATAAQAETRVFGCKFVESYSPAQASAALSQARAIVGIEALSLYGHYVSLKNECRTNPNAKRAVRLSPQMVALID
jgi:hypothetical protein